MNTIKPSNPNTGSNIQLIEKHTGNTFRGIAAIMVILSHYAQWYCSFFQAECNAETLHTAFTKLGVYGVDIFFLLSGYAMVKSFGKPSAESPHAGKMNFFFVLRRTKNVYLPYFIVVGIIELFSEGFTSFHDFWLFTCGYDYWYMNVLFILYAGFIVIYALVKNKAARVFLFSVFIYAYSYILYKKGMYDFWYVSNITFALGVTAAEYEPYFKKAIDKIWLPSLGALGAGMFFVIKYGLFGAEIMAKYSAEALIWFKIGATLIWTLFVLILAAKWRRKEKIFAFLGKISLYLYLTHTFIFMKCANNLSFPPITRVLISAAATVIISLLCRLLITKLPELIKRSASHSR